MTQSYYSTLHGFRELLYVADAGRSHRSGSAVLNIWLCGCRQNNPPHIIVGDSELQTGHHFNYLGSIISSRTMIDNRIAKRESIIDR